MAVCRGRVHDVLHVFDIERQHFFGSLFVGDPRRRPGIDRCLDLLVGREP